MQDAIVIAPVRFARKGSYILTIFWNDETVTDYDVYKLRINCPCAACVNEWTGERMLDEKSVDKKVKPVSIFSIGRYAMGIYWSDGHKTGIYSYDYLRRLNNKSR